MALNGKREGYERDELCAIAGISDGGTFSDILTAMIAGGFIMRYIPFGMNERHPHYKLYDPFCLFYLRFVKGNSSLDSLFFQQHVESSSMSSWRGNSFELVCLHHVDQIKSSLGLDVIRTNTHLLPLGSEIEGKKAQIDLIISRADNVVDVCEIKFVGAPFSITESYYNDLVARSAIIFPLLKKKQSIRNVLISSFGLAKNKYSAFFNASLSLDDLFK